MRGGARPGRGQGGEQRVLTPGQLSVSVWWAAFMAAVWQKFGCIQIQPGKSHKKAKWFEVVPFSPLLGATKLSMGHFVGGKFRPLLDTPPVVLEKLGQHSHGCGRDSHVQHGRSRGSVTRTTRPSIHDGPSTSPLLPSPLSPCDHHTGSSVTSSLTRARPLSVS